MILNEYSKTAWVNGASPDINKANLDNLEQGVYDVTAKAMELAAYEVNAATSATAAANSANQAAASVAIYTDLVEDVDDLQTDLSNLTTTVANHAKWSTTEEVVIGTYDGKPLYRKAVLIANLANAQGITSYAHGIANIKKIVIGNDSHMTDGTSFLPIPFAYHALAEIVGAYATATNVIVSLGKSRSTFSAVIFIEYTKTTD